MRTYQVEGEELVALLQDEMTEAYLDTQFTTAIRIYVFHVKRVEGTSLRGSLRAEMIVLCDGCKPSLYKCSSPVRVIAEDEHL